MEKWFKWTYVCSMCDALVEYTIKQENIPLDVNMDKYNCVCGGKGILVSYVNATIKPLREKEEEQTMETSEYLQNQIAELTNKLANHSNCDYWKSENGRVQGQIIDLIHSAHAEETEASEILVSLAEIIDYNPVKEIEFTATMKFTGRIEVRIGEDVNLEELLEDAYVDINNGDVVIDGYELYDAEEC